MYKMHSTTYSISGSFTRPLSQEKLVQYGHVADKTRSIVKIVLLCRKQGLALRGHRDDKISSTEEDDAHSNEGNFVELVQFRAETDPVLAQHLAKSPRNARYTSKTIQNELVEVIGECICNDIIAEVK